MLRTTTLKECVGALLQLEGAALSVLSAHVAVFAKSSKQLPHLAQKGWLDARLAGGENPGHVRPAACLVPSTPVQSCPVLS